MAQHPMTRPPLDLEAIRQRVEAATPGPWVRSCGDSGHSRFELWCSVVTDRAADVICDMDGVARTSLNESDAKDDGRHDADFIAHAREDVPALLAEIERLRSEPRTPRGVIARAADYIGHEPDCTTDECIACDLRALLEATS